MLCDAHCHLSMTDAGNSLRKVQEKGVKLFSCALNKEEIAFHLSHPLLYTGFYAGANPLYTPNDNSHLPLVKNLAETKQIVAIGEIGMDKRCEYKDWMKRTFLDYLKLAVETGLGVVLHTVGFYPETYKILKRFKLRGILLHGFIGSEELIDLFISLGAIFSVSPRLMGCHARQVSKIGNYGRFVLETDAPAAANYDEIFTALQIMHFYSSLREEEILQIQKSNIEEFFQINLAAG